MAITILKKPAAEQGLYIVPVAFYDEAGALVVPRDITWSLLVGQTICNGRNNVPIPADSQINIALSGADLAITKGKSRLRRLLVLARYDSDLGTNLPLNAECRFTIANLVGVGVE